MSFFLCLALPQEFAPRLRRVFDSRIHLTDVSDTPIGQATRGKNKSWVASLLQIGSSSASLLGKGSIKRTHNSDKSELFISGIQALIKDESCPIVAFLYHWMQGYIATENIILMDERRIKATDLNEILNNIQEDVRYIVLNQDHP